jgi:hypothetical protein
MAMRGLMFVPVPGFFIAALLLPSTMVVAQVQVDRNFLPQGPAPDQGTAVGSSSNSGAVQAILSGPRSVPTLILSEQRTEAFGARPTAVCTGRR